MKKFKHAAAASILVLALGACALPEDDGTTAADRAEVNQKDKKGGDKKAAGKKAPKEKSAPKETLAQENARKSAENYLDFSAFSRSGLIEQLEFEEYSVKDATYAVDTLKVDWNKQAAASAENYLETSSFSRGSLIEQLKFEGFTQAQAEYGAKAVGY